MRGQPGGPNQCFCDRPEQVSWPKGPRAYLPLRGHLAHTATPGGSQALASLSTAVGWPLRNPSLSTAAKKQGCGNSQWVISVSASGAALPSSDLCLGLALAGTHLRCPVSSTLVRLRMTEGQLCFWHVGETFWMPKESSRARPGQH